MASPVTRPSRPPRWATAAPACRISRLSTICQLRRLHLLPQVDDQRREVHLVEAGGVAVAPALGDRLHHLEHAEPVGGAAEVAEDVVELHAALEHQPARHGRVEAAGDQGDGPPLDADRQAAVPPHLVEEEVGAPRLELDVGGHLRRREVHPAGSGVEQGAAERALDPRRVEADAVALAAGGWRARRSSSPAPPRRRPRRRSPPDPPGSPTAAARPPRPTAPRRPAPPPRPRRDRESPDRAGSTSAPACRGCRAP